MMKISAAIQKKLNRMSELPDDDDEDALLTAQQRAIKLITLTDELIGEGIPIDLVFATLPPDDLACISKHFRARYAQMLEEGTPDPGS